MKQQFLRQTALFMAAIFPLGCYGGYETVKAEYRYVSTEQTKYQLIQSEEPKAPSTLTGEPSAESKVRPKRCVVESRDLYERTVILQREPDNSESVYAWINIGIGVLGLGLIGASPYIEEHTNNHIRGGMTTSGLAPVFAGAILTAVGIAGGFQLYQMKKDRDPITLTTPYYGPFRVETFDCSEQTDGAADEKGE